MPSPSQSPGHHLLVISPPSISSPYFCPDCWTENEVSNSSPSFQCINCCRRVFLCQRCRCNVDQPEISTDFCLNCLDSPTLAIVPIIDLTEEEEPRTTYISTSIKNTPTRAPTSFNSVTPTVGIETAGAECRSCKKNVSLNILDAHEVHCLQLQRSKVEASPRQQQSPSRTAAPAGQSGGMSGSLSKKPIYLSTLPDARSPSLSAAVPIQSPIKRQKLIFSSSDDVTSTETEESVETQSTQLSDAHDILHVPSTSNATYRTYDYLSLCIFPHSNYFALEKKDFYNLLSLLETRGQGEVAKDGGVSIPSATLHYLFLKPLIEDSIRFANKVTDVDHHPYLKQLLGESSVARSDSGHSSDSCDGVRFFDPCHVSLDVLFLQSEFLQRIISAQPQVRPRARQDEDHRPPWCLDTQPYQRKVSDYGLLKEISFVVADCRKCEDDNARQWMDAVFHTLKIVTDLYIESSNGPTNDAQYRNESCDFQDLKKFLWACVICAEHIATSVMTELVAFLQPDMRLGQYSLAFAMIGRHLDVVATVSSSRQASKAVNTGYFSILLDIATWRFHSSVVSQCCKHADSVFNALHHASSCVMTLLSSFLSVAAAVPIEVVDVNDIINQLTCFMRKQSPAVDQALLTLFQSLSVSSFQWLLKTLLDLVFVLGESEWRRNRLRVVNDLCDTEIKNHEVPLRWIRYCVVMFCVGIGSDGDGDDNIDVKHIVGAWLDRLSQGEEEVHCSLSTAALKFQLVVAATNP